MGSQSSSPRRNSLEKEELERYESSVKEKQPTCCASKDECPIGIAFDYWHPLGRSSIPKRLEANQRSEIIQWQSPKHWISPKLEKKLLR